MKSPKPLRGRNRQAFDKLMRIRFYLMRYEDRSADDLVRDKQIEILRAAGLY